MELLVIRHAIAEDVDEAAAAGCPDAARRLTERGRRRMERAVRGLLALDLPCELALHSPWTRATQTAALLAPLVTRETRPWAALARAPDAAMLAELQHEVEALGKSGGTLRAEGEPRLALVGHQPWLGELVAWLTTGKRAAGEAMPLGKGAVAWLAGRPAPGSMELRALLPSFVLRTLGQGKRAR